MPEGSDRDISEFGVQFELVDGLDPHETFADKTSYVPNIKPWPQPGVTPINGGQVTFYWYDGPPEVHKNLQMTVEVSFIYGSKVGPAAVFKIE